MVEENSKWVAEQPKHNSRQETWAIGPCHAELTTAMVYTKYSDGVRSKHCLCCNPHFPPKGCTSHFLSRGLPRRTLLPEHLETVTEFGSAFHSPWIFVQAFDARSSTLVTFRRYYQSLQAETHYALDAGIWVDVAFFSLENQFAVFGKKSTGEWQMHLWTLQGCVSDKGVETSWTHLVFPQVLVDKWIRDNFFEEKDANELFLWLDSFNKTSVVAQGDLRMGVVSQTLFDFTTSEATHLTFEMKDFKAEDDLVFNSVMQTANTV